MPGTQVMDLDIPVTPDNCPCCINFGRDVCADHEDWTPPGPIGNGRLLELVDEIYGRRTA